MPAMRFLVPLFVSLAIAASPALARADADKPADPLIMTSDGFLDAHPDLKFRQAGLKAYEDGDYEAAMRNFKRAARFADKPSQGMVAEMLWRGEGIEQDRPAAYAWMDLAAERHFRPMLIQREIYWSTLSADEREAAVKIGEQLYAEYGDKVAKPRTERKMRMARRQATGSRTGGFIGNLTITFNTLGGPVTVDGSQYYHPDYWEPERYWTWQEKGWKNPPRGVVEVGPLSAPTGTGGEPAPTEDADPQ